jgi:LSD1 subclass zinc finger protein
MPDSRTPFCGARPDGGCALTGEDGDYLLETSNYLPAPDAGLSVSTTIDMLTGLTWTVASSSGQLTGWSSAAQTCSALGAGWSLPTVIELVSLLDLGHAGAALIDPGFPGFTTAGPYWTVTQPSTTSAAVVDFNSGSISPLSLTSGAASVRCALPPQTITAPSYVGLDAGSSSVLVEFTDTHTSFTWAYQSKSYPLWSDALSACNQLESLDCSGWRLPSYKEMATLLAFGAVTNQLYDVVSAWTSSASASNPGDYLLLAIPPGSTTLQGGPVNASMPSLSQSGSFCVRGP